MEAVKSKSTLKTKEVKSNRKIISKALKGVISDFPMSHIILLVILGLNIGVVAFILDMITKG